MTGKIDFRVGDCLDVFGAEPDASFDSFVCDFPAGISMMSRAWDTDKGGRDKWIAYWAERCAMMKRKAKPGAYALIWALPRTVGWTTTAIEDGGWFVQDVVTHVFSTGWPKSRSALKPASEMWVLARNGSGGALQIEASRVPRGEPINADRGAMGYGRGGSRVEQPPNIAGSWPTNFAMSHCDECEENGARKVRGSDPMRADGTIHSGGSKIAGPPRGPCIAGGYVGSDGLEAVAAFNCLAACDCGLSALAPSGGEAPLCACGAVMGWSCPVAGIDRQSGERTSGLARAGSVRAGLGFGGAGGNVVERDSFADSGGASRYFPCFSYNSKAPQGERQAGCDDMYWRLDKRSPFGFVRVTREEWEALPEGERARGNVHATIKKLSLMRWLVGLVTPPGGRVGDITAGSGGTGIATHLLNAVLPHDAAPMSFLGCDICPEAVEIAEARLRWWRSVRHDVKPTKRDAVATVGDPRQVSLFGKVAR